MAWAAKDTVPSGGLIGNSLEVFGMVKQGLRRDVVLKSILTRGVCQLNPSDLSVCISLI